MVEPEHFDVLIIGSGQGGKLLAWHMAGSGHRTAVIERRWIGGSCPNIACMPSKNVMWSARVAHLAHHAGQFGIVADPVETDMAAVLQRKRDMVNREIELHLQNYRATGAELIMGSGRFVAPKILEAHLNDGSTRLLAGERVFLNLGSHAAIPGIPGLEAARPLTHVRRSNSTTCPRIWSCSEEGMSASNWHRPIAVSAAASVSWRSDHSSPAGKIPTSRMQFWRCCATTA